MIIAISNTTKTLIDHTFFISDRTFLIEIITLITSILNIDNNSMLRRIILLKIKFKLRFRKPEFRNDLKWLYLLQDNPWQLRALQALLRNLLRSLIDIIKPEMKVVRIDQKYIKLLVRVIKMLYSVISSNIDILYRLTDKS